MSGRARLRGKRAKLLTKANISAQRWAGHKRRFTATLPQGARCLPVSGDPNGGLCVFSTPFKMPAPREDVQAALAGIEAAGNDTETLAEAIENAAFLEDTPGEPRQTLRGKKAKHIAPLW